MAAMAKRDGNGNAPATLEALVIEGNLRDLTPDQRLEWYKTRCEAAGLDPRAQPFQYLELSGKLTLYATKAATDQLAAMRGLNVEIIHRDVTEGDVYEAVCRVRDASGRVTEDIGAVSVGGLRAEALANARMKAVTKAKRRAILAHCGLGMLDETETETVPGARRIQVTEHGEIVGALPEPQERGEDSQEARATASRRLFAIASERGIDTKNAELMRGLAGEALWRDVPRISDLTATERDIVADWIDSAREENAPATEGDRARQGVENAEAGTYAQQTVA